MKVGEPGFRRTKEERTSRRKRYGRSLRSERALATTKIRVGLKSPEKASAT